MKGNNRRQIGRQGEDITVTRLVSAGYQILARNYYTRYGEIDIIAEKDGLLLFIEVKTRLNDKFGYPESSVNAKKREHMMAAASHFLQEHLPDWDGEVRMDVVAIRYETRQQDPEIEWFENAVHD